MSKNFDELSDDFLNRKPNRGIPKSLDELKDLINSFRKKNKHEDLENQYGKPDSTKVTQDGDTTINEQKWETDFGSVTRIVIDGDLTPEQLEDIVSRYRVDMNIPTVKPLSLEEQLEIAVKNENYEEAARLKEQIDSQNVEKEEN